MIKQALIVVATKDRARNHGCFDEVAEAFEHALGIAGTKATHGDRSLVFNAHTLGTGGLPNKQDVIYQSEQIGAEYGWPTPDYLKLLKKHEVWDYSQKNVDALKEYGVDAKFVPIRYMPCMTKFESVPEKDIDVLFYGSANARRMKILCELSDAGVNVQRIFGAYGADRDHFIARSKVILNIHYQDGGAFEIFRCAHLFANSKCVVSEFGRDADLDGRHKRSAIFCHRDEIVDTCLELLGSDRDRKWQEEDAFNCFKEPLLSDELRSVIDA